MIISIKSLYEAFFIIKSRLGNGWGCGGPGWDPAGRLELKNEKKEIKRI
jgi:hypothetical protein